MSTTFCRKCGTQLREGARFCGGCGSQLANQAAPPAAEAVPSKASNECASCGRTLKPNAKFCSGCGTRVESKPAVTADAPPPPSAPALMQTYVPPAPVVASPAKAATASKPQVDLNETFVPTPPPLATDEPTRSHSPVPAPKPESKPEVDPSHSSDVEWTAQCDTCGAAVTATPTMAAKFCSDCAAPLVKGAKFCAMCAHPTPQLPPPPAPTPASAPAVDLLRTRVQPEATPVVDMLANETRKDG